MEKEQRILNAKIESTMLGIEDHGIFTFSLILDYGGGTHQGAGGFGLSERDSDTEKVYGFQGTTELLSSILEIAGVLKWEALPHKYIRVKKGIGYNDTIDAIGHITEDKWLDFKEFFDEFRTEDGSLRINDPRFINVGEAE